MGQYVIFSEHPVPAHVERGDHWGEKKVKEGDHTDAELTEWRGAHIFNFLKGSENGIIVCTC